MYLDKFKEKNKYLQIFTETYDFCVKNVRYICSFKTDF